MTSRTILGGSSEPPKTIVAFGDTGTFSYSLDDGVTWTASALGSGEAVKALCYANDKFVAVGVAGTPYTSTDGINWTSWTATGRAFTQIIWNPVAGIYVGVNETIGSAHYSSDGQSWTEVGVFAGALWTDLAVYSSGLMVASGTNGKLMYGSNALSWTPVTYGSNTWTGVTRNDLSGGFMTVSTVSMAMVSNNGFTWTNAGSTLSVNSVAYKNSLGLSVAVGNGGRIVTYNTGPLWTVRTSGTVENLIRVRLVNDKYIAVGANGTILTSINGTSWTSRSSGTTDTLYCVA